MRRFIAVLNVVLATAGLGAGGQSFAAEQDFVLQDHINRTWTRELVSFPVSFEPKACRAKSVSLRGPKGPMACQLADVERWDGTFVKRATLWFIADVPKLSRRGYVLSYGVKPVAVAGPKTNLKVAARGDTIELTTSHFGIRLLAGEKTYREPIASDAVPGPVLGFRSADGKWFGGGGTLYGPLKVKGYSARLLDEGPVLARWAVRYTYADGNTLSLRVTLAAGDNAVFFEQTAAKDAIDFARIGYPHEVIVNGRGPKDNGLWIGLTGELAPPVFRCQKEHYLRRPFFKANPTKIGDWADIPMASHRPGLVTSLMPWRDWWSSYTQTEIRFRRTDRQSELRVLSWDPGAWVDPKAPEAPRRASAKAVPLMKAADGSIFMSVSTLVGVRKWSVGETDIPKTDVYPQAGYKFGRSRTLWQRGANDPRVARGLNVVKDYVLEWEEPPRARHPRLFISADELEARRPELRKDKERIAELRKQGKTETPLPGTYTAYALAAYLRTGDAKIGRELKLVERLRRHLGLLGEYDIRGGALFMACLYDGLVDSELVTPTDRKLFRAQMAFQAYRWADPGTWSAQRGYASGNPNMTVVIEMTRGLVGCMLSTHPESANWGRPAVASMKRFMKLVGSKGEWMESSHYAHVSTSTLLPFAIAARRANLHDFLADGRPTGGSDIKRLLTYLAKSYTPADPQRGGLRVTAPWGRATSGAAFGHTGMMAAATAKTDPAFSRVMQWIWKRTGHSLRINTFGQRFGGFEEVVTNRLLPEQTPDWTSEWLPKVGVVMRHGMGTRHEHYLSVLTEPDTMFVRSTEAGAVTKWFCRGVPIGGAFAEGYDHRHQLFMSRVQPARRRGDMNKLFDIAAYHGKDTVRAFAALPTADYLDFQFEPQRVDKRWRNCKTIKGPVPEWPPILREGKVPMTWRRQLMLVKDVDPSKTSYLVLRDTVTGNQPTMWQFWTLSEKIGTPSQVRNRRWLLADKPGNRMVQPRQLEGDRFTALGQFSMDLEYFIAAPKDTPRQTLRFGDKYAYPVKDLEEYQDLLHLQLPGDGHYFVVLFPRLRKERAPTFETLGQGTVIKIAGTFGTDYAFLSDTRMTTQAEPASFRGTAGVVQDRKTGLVLALTDKGRIVYRQYGVGGAAPVALRVGASDLTVHLPRDHKGSRVTIQAPGAWTLKDPAVGATMAESSGKRFRLTVPKGVSTVVLEQR